MKKTSAPKITATDDLVDKEKAVEEVKETPETPEIPKAPEAPEKPETTAEEVGDVPTVDQNAALKIEDAKTQEENVPDIDKNSSLKVESVREADEEAPIEKSNKKLFIFGAVIFIFTVLATSSFGIFWAQNSSKVKKEVTPKEEQEVSTTPAPKKTLKREDWSLEVLNGSGVAGTAKKTADKLEALGYKIAKTGNADKQSYKESELYIAVDTSKEDTVLLLEDLGKELGITSVSGELKDSTANARIIIGEK